MMRDLPSGPGRLELKFATSAVYKAHIESWLSNHARGFVRTYPERRINNVYFDRHDLADYFSSSEGESIRSKVRYRWYGDSPLPGPGQLEVKLRRNHLGWKETYEVQDFRCPSLVWKEVIQALRDQLPSEAARWLDRTGQPVVMNRYTREYWATRDGAVRVTLDRDQTVYGQNSSPTVNVRRKALTDEAVILEVKGERTAIDFVGRLVADLPIRRSRNSKYCRAVEAVL